MALRGASKNIVRVTHRKKSTVVLSSDQYILDVAAVQGKTYSDVFQAEIGPAILDLKHKLKSAVAENKDIFLDQTNLTLKSRKEKLGRIPAHYTKIGVWIRHAPDQFPLLLDRVASRGLELNHVPEHVMRSMWDSSVEPELSEGFDSILIFDVFGVEQPPKIRD